MPAIISKNSDLEFDSLQPCFYPDEDDFYFCGPDSAPPGEDIWKKFELLPTPPLSPSRAALPGEPATASPEADPLGFGLGNPLDWASELLLLPEDDIWGASDDGDLNMCVKTPEVQGLIRDLKWGIVSLVEMTRRLKVLTCGKASHAPSSTQLILVQQCLKWVTVSFKVKFLMPHQRRLGEEDDDDEEEEGDEEEEDDDDDDDDEDEEEEEEIDVVTVEKRRSTNKASPMATGTVTISVHPKSQEQRGLVSGSGVVSRFVSRAPQELILKRSSVHQQQHNYAAPSPYASDDDPAPPTKKQKTSDAPRPPTRTISSSSSSSSTSCSSVSSTSGARSKRSTSGDSSPRGSSDSEDSERRRNHNILERQRRNDLRSSFLMLRDHVPELAHNEKAAKVLILKKATEYVSSLETEEMRLQQEKDRLQARRQQLMRRLEQARTR
ncbi:hypothetical protein PAMP_014083 [Pampus punctatissimus]